MALVPDLSMNYAQNAPGIDPHIPSPEDYSAIANPVITTQTIALGASSVQSAVFQPRTTTLRLMAKTSAARYLVGPPPLTATATSILLPPNVEETIGVRPGWVIAAIQDTAAGELNITELA